MSVAQLTWLDLTAADRDKIRQVLTLFSEQGTVDELGLGSLRDMLSNSLFPGLSVLHTRLRYVFFIPWIYQRIEELDDEEDPADLGRRLEISLIEALAKNKNEHGIIGIQARQSLSRLASSAYWALLVHLGIFVPERSQSWYHANFRRLVRRKSDIPRTDDPGVAWSKEPIWHPRIPKPPPGFPGHASFELTRDEAEFVRGRIQERCNGTLLSWLAREGSTELAPELWNDPLIGRLPSSIAEVVELARRFSRHVEGAPLLYNLMLAEARHKLQGNAKDQDLADAYRARMLEWAANETAEGPFQPDALWVQAADRGMRVATPQRHFLESWTDRINDIGPHAATDDGYLRKLIMARERRLKGDHRARLVNTGRLLDWSGDVGTGRMVFRWPQARQLLIDLHEGLRH